MRDNLRFGKLQALVTILCGALAVSGCAAKEEQSSAYSGSVVRTVRVDYSRTQIVRPALDTFGILIYHSKADIYPGVEGTVELIWGE